MVGPTHRPQHQTCVTDQSTAPFFSSTPTSLSFPTNNKACNQKIMKAFYSNCKVAPPTTVHSQLFQFSRFHHQLFPVSSPPSLQNLIFRNRPLRIRPIIRASSSSSMASSANSPVETKPFAVLFVCLGNICRSPAAEGVFKDLVKKRQLEYKFFIDSAGTIGYHEGNPADPRMRSSSSRRGIEITSTSRPIRPSDFRDFDLILAMDKSNRADILAALEKWKKKENLPPNADKKVKLMCSYCKKHNETEVPDPYYGGQQGFEKVLDLLEDACESLLDSILAGNESNLN